MTTPLVRPTPPSAAVAAVPALYAPTAQAAKRFIEYFAAHIRNPNTRRAYFHAVLEFSSWCEAQKFTQILDIEPPRPASQRASGSPGARSRERARGVSRASRGRRRARAGSRSRVPARRGRGRRDQTRDARSGPAP